MIAIYFVWNGSDDPEDARAARIGSLGIRWHAHRVGNVVIGVLYAETQQARILADVLHKNIATLPSPGGSLTTRHAQFLQKEFPSAKAGDSMRSILQHVHSLTGDTHFNPDNW